MGNVPGGTEGAGRGRRVSFPSAPSALRPWRMLDVTRLILAVCYTVVTFAFANKRSWAEEAEHGIILAMLVLAAAAPYFSARSWVTEMRLRKPIVAVDAMLFLALLTVTNPSNSPYFPGALFVVVETALIVRRRFHLLVGLFAGMTAILTLWVDQLSDVAAEPEAEHVALRVLYLIVVVSITGMLLGPRRETLLETERAARLKDTALPAGRGGAGAFLLHAIKAASGGSNAAVLFRMASHEAFRFASASHGDQVPPSAGEMLGAGTGWHDHVRGASIVLSSDDGSALRPLSDAGRAWAELLGARTLMSLHVSLGAFEAVAAVRMEDPCHEDAVAIALRVFEGACEELVVRESLDLAHVIAGARERERLQRELHDSVLQALASIRFQIAPLLNGASADAEPVVRNVDRIAKDQMATIRTIINPEVEEEDFAYLPETLAMVVHSLGEQWGIACELKIEEGNCATSAAIGRELSFAVREIVANAVRHAKAQSVHFTLRPEGKKIELHVTDDGVPSMARLGPSGAVPSRSLMRRVQALGGEVYLHNLAGRTMIQITVPRK